MCSDGEYLAAYTSEGIQLWRRKIGGDNSAVANVEKNDNSRGRPETGRLDLHSGSVCDLVEVGAGQQKIRDLLSRRNLSFTEGASGERAWIVEQSGSQCKLWFDSNSALTKKRKTFLNE
jgi:hypothetical protein